MSIVIKTELRAQPPKELRCCAPTLMLHEGKVVVIITAYREALCFDPDGGIMYGEIDYFSPSNGYTFIREMLPGDSLTITGDTNA